MGKIKKTIFSKQDRPAVEPKPPSFRRFKRKDKQPTLGRMPSMRGLRRPAIGGDKRTGEFAQRMPATVVFRFKKRKRPEVGVVHRHYSGERKDETSTKQIKVLTCGIDDSARIAEFKLMAKDGLGKIERKKRKVIWHRVDKQDKYFKQ